MDEKNVQNEQNNSNYQDNTANVYQSSPVQVPYEEPKKTNALAIVGLILGIISIIACCTTYIGMIIGVAGLICSILSRKHGKTGVGTAGMVCSIIGIVLGVVMLIVGVASIGLMGSPEMMELFEGYGY